MRGYLVYGSTHPRALETPAPAAARWEFQAQARTKREARQLAEHYGRLRKLTAVRIFTNGAALGRLVETLELGD